MTSFISERVSESISDTLNLARQTLSGKRAALIGFKETDANAISHMVGEAHAFARQFPADVDPAAELLKPFELMLVDVEGVSRSSWLSPEQMIGVVDRTLALGSCPALLTLLAQPRVAFRQFCIWPTSPEELLFRCVSGLHPGSHATSRTATGNSTVVLADDDASITSLLRLALQRNGLTCETASDGAQALYLIEKYKPSAAVLDVGMPAMDGFEVLSRIRSNPALVEIKVILLTGREQEMDIVRGFSLGADDYVIKPFNPMEVLMRLKRAVGRI